MPNREKEMLEALFGAAIAAAIIEQGAKKNAQAEEDTATPRKTDDYHALAQNAKELYDAFMLAGFSGGQATDFVAAILTK